VARELGIKNEEVEEVVSVVGGYLADKDIVLSLGILEEKLEKRFSRGTDIAEMMNQSNHMTDVVEIMRWMNIL
jgi:hypothetical protein